MIDYLLVRVCDFSNVLEFCIKPFAVYSDHAPLTFFVKSSKSDTPIDNYPYITDYVKWDALQRENFRKGIISNLPAFKNLIDHFDTDNPNCIDDLISNFTEILLKVADPLFKKEMYINQNTDLQQTRKNKRFDTDCFGAKERYKKALFVYNRSKIVTNRQFLADEKELTKKKKNTDQEKKRI